MIVVAASRVVLRREGLDRSSVDRLMKVVLHETKMFSLTSERETFRDVNCRISWYLITKG